MIYFENQEEIIDSLSNLAKALEDLSEAILTALPAIEEASSAIKKPVAIPGWAIVLMTLPPHIQVEVYSTIERQVELDREKIEAEAMGMALDEYRQVFDERD